MSVTTQDTPKPKKLAPLTKEEKDSLLAVAALVLVGGYYSPIDNRTVTTVAITGGLGGAAADWGRFKIDKWENITMYQKVIAWTALGAGVGILVDTLLRPKLQPERI